MSLLRDQILISIFMIYSLVRLANNPEISLIKDELSIKILF
ncbi:hypothetical protein BGAPBR_E0036 (plasmid) [Borreliella garinii PBr]|uniref:Uncharacterized protein n=1 Tax=Borreliella garinii PBr TaxID=498743 RepID=B8F0L6_BORGR|nr:hypothetical protein BGAPBR_E0036 [Borreliella garinii PBr]